MTPKFIFDQLLTFLEKDSFSMTLSSPSVQLKYLHSTTLSRLNDSPPWRPCASLFGSPALDKNHSLQLKKKPKQNQSKNKTMALVELRLSLSAAALIVLELRRTSAHRYLSKQETKISRRNITLCPKKSDCLLCNCELDSTSTSFLKTLYRIL